MTKTPTIVVTAFVLAGAASARAEDKKPPAAAPAAAMPATPPPKPSPELDAFMKPYEGSWKCETKFPAGAMGPGSPDVTAKSTVKFKKDLDGFFYRGEFDVKKQKGVQMPMKGVIYIGWDARDAQMLFSFFDNMGSFSTAAGKPQGDMVTYTGEMFAMGSKMKSRESMEKKGDKEILHKMEVDMGKGFVTFGEDDCKK